MSGGVLSFTLGIETSNFLRGIGLASGQIISFSALAQGLQTSFQKVWSAIERGGRLSDLSNRTGESVKSLFQLQAAFDLVGIRAEGVSPMLLRLQRMMGGVDEQGNKTDDVLAELGLNLDRLSQMNAPQKLLEVANALNKIGGDRAANLASKLFGRDGAGDIMQIARDAKEFAQSLKDTAAEASMMQRTASAFDKIGDTVNQIKRKLDSFWTGIAEGAAPAIQTVVDWLNEIDFVGWGQKIGQAINAAFRMIKDGHLVNLLSKGFLAAVEQFSSFFTAAATSGATFLSVALIDGMRSVFAEMGNFFAPLGKSLVWALVAAGSEFLAWWNDVGAEFGVPGAARQAEQRRAEAADFSELSRAYLSTTDPQSIMRIMQGTLKNAPGLAQAAWKRSLKGNEFQLTADFMAELAKWRDGTLTSSDPAPSRSGKPNFQKVAEMTAGSQGSAASAFEKMGFVTSNGGRTDYSAQIAANTREMAATLRAVNARLGPGYQSPFGNNRYSPAL